MPTPPSIPDSAAVRSAIALRRQTVRSWAKAHQFPEKTVYAVIAGNRSGARNPKLLKALRLLVSS